MVFTWHEFGSGDIVLNPEADFRLNTLSRAISVDLKTDADDIWWLIVVQPAIDPKTNENYTLLDIWEFARHLGLGDDPGDFLLIPPEYSQDFRKVAAPETVTFYARRNYLNRVNRYVLDPRANQTGIAWFEVGPAFRPDDIVIQSDPFIIAQPTEFEVPEGSVVMAVIDNGIAVGHELFRGLDAAAGTSRVAFFWNMDGVPSDDLPPSPHVEPATVGNVWTGNGLTQQLGGNMHNGVLDDAAFYQSIGAIDWSKRRHTPIAHRLSHGTHVMGLAAGFPSDGTDPADAEKRPIIAVNLRTSDVQDPSGSLFATWLEQALFFILDRHKRISIKGRKGVRPPLVINFSFGNYAGPHDGTGAIEKKIGGALSKASHDKIKCEFVLPAGNGNESRCHARIEIDSGHTREKSLDWRVQPSDRSLSALQIWLDEKGAVADDYVTLTVDGPGGIEPVEVPSHHPVAWQELLNEEGERLGLVYFLGANVGPFKRGHFGVLLYATDSPEDVGPFAPSGLWKMHLEAPEKSGDVGARAWVIRDETLPGYPVFGRQSYFDDPLYAEFFEPGLPINPLDRPLIGGRLGYDPLATSALVRRAGTLSGFASGDRTVVISGFVNTDPREDCPIALYSASGPTNNPAKTGPDASAQSNDSIVMPGVLSAGSASGSFVAMPGTSVSAPQVARWIADELAMGKAAGPAEVRAAAGAMDPPGGSTKPPDTRSGGGRMLELPILFGQSRWPGSSR
ncbi:S8 family serine peptidase [Roseibium sp. MMSF_3412]|uniref:S8 family serine peptidase n=1 Tax=Roseibium sp. MMSF_3412 TaxID=3046712 RepID=UPI00273FB0B9|nr:S8 family serine peptidase [Roseibium sp. MMSF_3412]